MPNTLSARRWPVLRDYILMTVGALLVAVAVRVFLVPNQVLTGGITGISQLMNRFFGTPVGVVTLVLNVPLLIIGVRRLGGFVFGVRTIYTITVMSLAIDLLAPYARPVTTDPLLYSLYGGMIEGVGLGLILRARGTAGGTDIIARLAETRFGLPPGQTLISLDALLFGSAFLIFGPEKSLYALLVAFVSSRAVDTVLAAGLHARQALIITAQPEAITTALLHDLGRGVTVLEAVGGYTGAARAVLLCVVARSELGAVKVVVAAVDPQAFMVISEVDEVIGEGFRPLPAGVPRPAPPTSVTVEEKALSERD
ncbi:MAG: YitT family protein [Chloroflexales bacterium]